jgi:hypothetical protein
MHTHRYLNIQTNDVYILKNDNTDEDSEVLLRRLHAMIA